MVTAYLIFLGLVAVERLVELRISRRNLRRALVRGGVETGKGHYPFLVLVHTLFLLSCAGEVLWFRSAFPGPVGWIALAGALGAQALRYWVIATLGDRWNVRIVVVPHLPPVTGGPYRWVRHPNYLAVAIEILCVPMVHGAWRTALVFSLANLVLLSIRIPEEERALGSRWASSFAGKPRFLPIPVVRTDEERR